jgi:Glycoside hydrolase 123, catalytic domain/Glycoside hydrolase 123 N-terminal domain
LRRTTTTFLLGLLTTLALATADVSLAADVKILLVTQDPLGTGKPGPAHIFGAGNGSFSAQLIAPAGSRARVTALKALKGPGIIPTSAITVRYAHMDGPGRKPFFDGLHPTPAAKQAAIQPIWVTVRVPRDAKPGQYRGKVTMGAKSVELQLTVADWVLPDPQRFVTHVGLIQSPDSVAMQYKTEMWSQRHWKLIEKSFELMGQVGTKTIYIPAQRRTHFGNEHGMIIWEKKAGKLTPDLSIVERYVEMARKHLGKIPFVCLYAWELDAADAGSFPSGIPKAARTKDRKILISVRKNGKLTKDEGPAWGTPECRAFWKPVFAGVGSILKKHGMSDSLLVGITGDYKPSEKTVKDFAEVAPGIKWVAHAHPFYNTIHGSDVSLRVSVWGIHGLRDPAAKNRWKWQRPRYYGWQRKSTLASFPRYGSIYGNAVSPRWRKKYAYLAMYRSLGEVAMTSQGQPKFDPGCNGFGRMGTDFWPVLKTKHRSSTICGRYPEAVWGQLTLNTATPAFLAPGTDGAVSTMRFENMREGLQEVEARIFIERALLDPKKNARLGVLASKAQKLLDERVRSFIKAIANKGAGWTPWATGNWQKKSAELYQTAAEVAARTSSK